MDPSNYLKRYPLPERWILLLISRKFKLSHSHQFKLLSYVYEIKRRDRLPLLLILIKAKLTWIYLNKNIQGKNKSRKLIDNLFEIRYPETSKLIAQGDFKL
jgi:hypothetical protein